MVADALTAGRGRAASRPFGADHDDLLLLAGAQPAGVPQPIRTRLQKRAERPTVPDGERGTQAPGVQGLKSRLDAAHRGLDEQQHAAVAEMAGGRGADPVQERASVQAGLPGAGRPRPAVCPRGFGTYGGLETITSNCSPPTGSNRSPRTARTRTPLMAAFSRAETTARTDTSTAVTRHR